jgi:hypothetical protein
LLFPWNFGTQVKSIPESESYVATDGLPASLSRNKAPIWGLRPERYYCMTVAGLLIWGAPSDERTGLSIAIATGHRQRSHSRVRVPWDSQPYFTVSYSRLPFSSPPTTRRVMVEVFDPASTRGTRGSVEVNSHSHILLYPLDTDHAQKTQPLYCCMVQTTQKTCVTCQTASSLVHYQQWAWRGRHRKHSLIYFPCWTMCTGQLLGNALLKSVTTFSRREASLAAQSPHTETLL